MWRRNSLATISRSINYKFRRRYSLATNQASFYLGAYHRFFKTASGEEILTQLNLKANVDPQSGILQVEGFANDITALREKLQTLFEHSTIVDFGLHSMKLNRKKLLAGAQALMVSQPRPQAEPGVRLPHGSGEFHIMAKTAKDLETILESIREYREKTDGVPIGIRAPQIIGKGGKNVSYIRKYAPCNIQVLDGFVFLSGEKKFREQAMRLIRRIIDQKAPPKCKFLAQFLREEIESMGISVNHLTTHALRTVLLSHGCSDEIVRDAIHSVSVGKPEITWFDLETALYAEEPALLRILENLDGSFRRSAEIMAKTAMSKIKLVESLQEIFGELTPRQVNIARKTFEDPASWTGKLRAMKQELWKREKIQAKGWENLNKAERIKVQRMKKLRQQIEELRESTRSAIEDMTFDVRIKRLPIDTTTELIEDEIRQAFLSCGEVVKFEWLKPRIATPHGHMGDVFCHFSSLKEKLAALDCAPFRYIHDPIFRLMINFEIDIDSKRTCLITSLPYNYEEANLIRFLAAQCNVTVTKIHRLGWRSAYIELRTEQEKIDLLIIKKLHWTNKSIGIEPARQLSPGFRRRLRKNDFVQFDKQFPHYLEYLLTQNPRGIFKEDVPLIWEKQFAFPFPRGYLERVELRRDCMDIYIRTSDKDSGDEVWFPRSFGADIEETLEVLES